MHIALADVFARCVVGDVLDFPKTVCRRIKRRGSETDTGKQRAAGLHAILTGKTGFGERRLKLSAVLAGKIQGFLKRKAQCRWGGCAWGCLLRVRSHLWQGTRRHLLGASRERGAGGECRNQNCGRKPWLHRMLPRQSTNLSEISEVDLNAGLTSGRVKRQIRREGTTGGVGTCKLEPTVVGFGNPARDRQTKPGTTRIALGT